MAGPTEEPVALDESEEEYGDPEQYLLAPRAPRSPNAAFIGPGGEGGWGSAGEDEEEYCLAPRGPCSPNAAFVGAGGEDGWSSAGGDERDSPSPRRRRPGIAARRNPRKADLFRSLDAGCELKRLFRTPSPPPPKKKTTAAAEDSAPIWPPRSVWWESFSYLTAMKYHPADPAIPVVNPDEKSLSHPPPEKSQEMIPESASEQIVVYENGQGEKDLPVPTQKRRLIIDTYSAQCNKCQKWRIIPTKQKYEEIREKLRSGPFSCEHASEWKPGVTCDDPTDASPDDGKFWAIDKQGIPQTPLGWDRTISIRSEGSTRFADVYYITPTGKMLRSKLDVGRYLKENPQCAAVIEQFSFSTPVPVQRDYVKKRPRQSKPLRLEEVPPLGCAPPIHVDIMHNNMLAPYEGANPSSDMPRINFWDDVQGSC